MSDLYLDMDLSELEDLTNRQQEELYKRISDAARRLSAATISHIQEEAQEKLHSSKEKFLENLSLEQVEDGLWVIKLKKDAVWIDDGLGPFSMLPGLLNSPKAKISKSGNRYIIVPFHHNQSAQNLNDTGKELREGLKKAMRNRNVNWKKIERNGDGTPKMGLLHSFDIGKLPKRKGGVLPLGAAGPKGRPYRANSLLGSGGVAGPEGRPYLFGVRVYQTPLFHPSGLPIKDTKGRQAVSRNFFTFRVASETQLGSHMWEHPGVEGKHFFDAAFDWALNEWENRIKPEIIRNFTKELDED